MCRFDRLKEKLIRPKGAILVITYLITLASVIGSLFMLIVDFSASVSLSFLAYTLFGIAAVTLGYTIYTIVIYAPGMKGRITEILESNELSSRMIKNFGFRTVVTATISFAGSIIYAVFNGALGIIYSSIWYGALASYYILISFTRGGLLLYQKNKDKAEGDERLIQAKKYRSSGIFLLVLNFALSSAIAQMIFDDKTFVYPGWIIYAFAAYAFTKMTMSIVNIFKSRQQDDLTIMGIRDINLIDAVVSILALQTALLHTFSAPEDISVSSFNSITGVFVSLFTVVFSIYMIVKAQRIIKEIEVSGDNGK